jgi:hypothetical protein
MDDDQNGLLVVVQWRRDPTVVLSNRSAHANLSRRSRALHVPMCLLPMSMIAREGSVGRRERRDRFRHRNKMGFGWGIRHVVSHACCTMYI